MADDRLPDAPEPPREPDTVRIVERRPLWTRVLKWTAIGLAAAAVVVAGLLLWLNSAPGRAFVARQIAGIKLESGLNLRIGRIDGSLFGAMVLHDVEMRDTRGGFATASEMALDWRPFAYLANRIDIRSLTSPEIRLMRLPALDPVPVDPNAPILPDINIDIARLDLARIDVAQGITGRRHIARLAGSAHLSDGRVQVDARGATIAARGVAGGDRLLVKLDAVPDRNRFDADIRLAAPAGGLVTGLAGLETPLTVSLNGDGDWKRWAGKALGTLDGAELADLSIEARDGSFRVRGPTHPGLYMKGPVERLASPRLDVALDAVWSDRKADTKFQLRSSALQVDGQGLIDLGNSRFGDFRVEAVLLTPGAIAPNLRGNAVRAAVALDGPFARPVVDYKIQAASIGFDETLVEQLYAEGRARVDADRILIPVRARAARVSGLNASAGSLLTNLTVVGDLAITGDQLLSDNLRLKSDRIDATALIVADLSAGTYNGALKGRVNDYEIEGLAVVNLTTDARLVAAPGGGWGIQGQVAARSSRIFSDGVRSFLGGNADASANVKLGADGGIDFSRLRLTAPEFRITGGSGRYDAKGRLLFDADGVSTRYGAMTAHVTGSFDAPQVLVRAPKPGLGVGLADLEAQIKGQNGAYVVIARGGTDYGPFTADALVQSGNMTTVTIRNARFAGMDIKGRLTQGTGPFDGRLDFAGSGVTGEARLAAQGSIQRLDFDARASNAVIPGVAQLTIGRGIASGSILFAETPQVVADAQFANLRNGALVLRTARAKIDYRGGRGTAQLVADGSSGVPFTLAANAKLEPKLWLVALRGTASGVLFRTPQPARIAIEGGDYRLLPSRVSFNQGSALVAGRYGDGFTVQTRLQKVDLAVVNAFVPGLGIGGNATGALDFTQSSANAFPRADARIEVTGFTRSSLATVSTPVNVTFSGRLLPEGGDARALIKRGGTTVGRFVATFRPLGPQAGSWQERLTSATLSGGIRYNGPAAAVFSLAGLPDQYLSGPIGIAADFGGRVDRPQLTGIVRASNLVYENETYGTRLSNLKLDGRFTSDQLVLHQLTATAGAGTVSAKGTIGLSSEQNFPLDLTADLANARLARSESLGATATGRLRITRDRSGGRIEGRLTIPEARYEVIRQGAAEVAELTGVRRKGQALQTPEQRAAAASVGSFALALRLRAERRLFISGMGLESEWSANITVRGTSANPVIGGTATIVRGTYDFAGRRFDINRGTIRFAGSRFSNPTIDIGATTSTEGVTAILNVSGTAERPRIAFTSSPALPQEEVLSRILFGSSVTNLSATEAIQLAGALNSLRGTGGGLNPLGKLRSATGIDRLRILSADQASGRGMALSAGKYITNDIYVEIITDAQGFTATQLEIALSRALSVLSTTSSFGGTGVSLKYSKDY
jgi:translocation and assembly module TamB